MNAARAPGVASSAARSESGVTPCAMPSSGSYSGATQVGRPPDSTSPSITDACALRWTTTGAPSGASARHNAWLPWVAPLVRNHERAAPYASAASCSARAYGVTPSPRSTPWMSCGMSSLSVCQPIAVRTPRSAPLPALWPGTWKRVEPRNPYAITASRYGAVGWSAEAMSAQACHDVLDDRVVLEPVHREVLAVAGLLEAAVRHLGDERDVVVDPHAAEAQRLRDPQRAADVARPDATTRARTACRWPTRSPAPRR